MAYRRKTDPIEALQFTKPYNAVEEFVPEAVFIKSGRAIKYLFIASAQPGHKKYELDDWIVRLSDGSYRKYSPDKFEATFEEVED